MTDREVMRNQLKLADEASESFKQDAANTQFKERVWMSFTLFCVRAICAALLEIADSVREAGARR